MAVLSRHLEFGKQTHTIAAPFATANPLSEDGYWQNGLAVGLDWNNLRVVGGVCCGTQAGNTGPPYDDSLAFGSGNWGPDQTVTATVSSTNPNTTAFCEVELWVRGAVSAHSVTGYEINFRATHDANQATNYIGIVRWNGALNDFTQLGTNASSPGIQTGDVIQVTIRGFTITAAINGTVYTTQTDSARTFPTGNPGLGHWYRINGAVGTAVTDYGLTAWSATD